MKYLKQILLFVTLLNGVGGVYSQSVNHYIIAPITFIYNDEIAIDLLASEPNNSTLNSLDNSITQGFLQPENYLFLGVELQEKSFYRFFPNPVFEGVYIEFKKDCGSDMRCVIYNSIGQEVEKLEFSIGYQNKLYIDLSFLNKGIYLMSIDDIENSLNSTLKLIKQ